MANLIVKADSRCLFDDVSPSEREFEFGPNYVDQDHVQLWMNNELLEEGPPPKHYTWINDTTVEITADIDNNSIVEMVRITPTSPEGVTPTELIYMIEEKRITVTVY